MAKMMELDVDSLKKDSYLKETDIKNSLTDCNQYQAANFELILQIKALKEDLDQTLKSKETIEQAKADLLEKFNAFGEQQQQNFDVQTEDLKVKQKVKRQKMAEKIIEQKERLEEFEVIIIEQKEGMDEMKEAYETIIGQLQSDIKLVNESWIQKTSDLELEGQKKTAEMQSKHSLNITQLQQEFQNLLDT